MFFGNVTSMRTIKFPENLRRLRKERQMTQSQLASLLNVDQRTVSAWENAVAEPSFATLALICDIFGESFDSILGE